MSEWINSKERLPDEYEAVWMRFDNNTMFIGCISYAGDPEGWLWCNSYGTFWWDDKKARWECDAEADDQYLPTHWMPLPEPPK